MTGFDPWPECQVHVEWGVTGAGLAAERGDIIVAVDVLSFSTTLTIAVSRDFTCLVRSPAEIERMGGPEAAAAALDARPTSKNRRVPPGHLSLSPASLLRAEPGRRALFTSLNGAAVASAAAPAPALLIGCPRNASAAARTAESLLADGVASRVTLVACGERWGTVTGEADGLRPSIEDWAGAGLISARLAERGLELSAEARTAAGTTVSLDPGLLAGCVSARELIARGFAEDVTLAFETDAAAAVPVRTGDGSFRRLRT